jgi:hypothetical protein
MSKGRLKQIINYQILTDIHEYKVKRMTKRARSIFYSICHTVKVDILYY